MSKRTPEVWKDHRALCEVWNFQKNSEEEERKEEGKGKKVLKASEHVVVYRHTYTKYKAEVESISKNEVLVWFCVMYNW